MKRDAKGRFAKGNEGGPGRKPRVTEQKFLQAMMNAVTEEQIAIITKEAVLAAMEGDWSARKWLSDNLFPPKEKTLNLNVDIEMRVLITEVVKQIKAYNLDPIIVFQEFLNELATDGNFVDIESEIHDYE